MSSSSESEAQGREEVFREYCRENVSELRTVFALKGLHFKQFRGDRIVLSFRPAAIIDSIASSQRFLCVLTHDGRHWRVRRDTFPVNYKLKIYDIFWDAHYFRISDRLLPEAIYLIYQYLQKWSLEYDDNTKERLQRFVEGDSDVDLFEDEEVLVLTKEEIEERHRRKEEIWQRMLPPPVRPVELERRRLRRRRIIRSSSSSS